MMTKMVSMLSTLRRWVMKSTETLSQGLFETDRGSRNPSTFAFSTLSSTDKICLCVLHVVVSHIEPEVTLLSAKHKFSTIMGA